MSDMPLFFHATSTGLPPDDEIIVYRTSYTAVKDAIYEVQMRFLERNVLRELSSAAIVYNRNLLRELLRLLCDLL